MKRIILLAVLLVMVSGAVSVQAATKEYPERDKKLPTYQTVTSLPDNIYTTLGSENGLKGNCYRIKGKIKGVYKGLSELWKALNVQKEINDPSVENIIFLLVSTSKGDVLVQDIFSATVNSIMENLNSGAFSKKDVDKYLASLKEKYIYFEPYKNLPKKKEKVKLLVTYSGYSELLKMPSFHYGINQYLVEGFKVDLNPEMETFKFDNIKIDIPKDWFWNTEGDIYKYFHSKDGYVKLYEMYAEEMGLDDYILDKIYVGYTKDGLKLQSTKHYTSKYFGDYYILQFKGTMNGAKRKLKEMIFLYKGDYYVISYLSNLTDHSDDYFKIFSKIIKTVKPLK